MNLENFIFFPAFELTHSSASSGSIFILLPFGEIFEYTSYLAIWTGENAPDLDEFLPDGVMGSIFAKLLEPSRVAS